VTKLMRELPELPAGDPGGDKRTRGAGAGGVSARLAAGGDHDDREIQLSEAEFWKEQAGNYGQLARSREAKETLAINYKGPDMAIAFNPKYIIDPLNALANDEIFLELIDELSPGVVKINGPFLYVVMPMRLS